MHPCNDSNDTMFKRANENIKQLMEYVSVADQSILDGLKIAHNKSLRNSGK
jgi:hypothetical protein